MRSLVASLIVLSVPASKAAAAPENWGMDRANYQRPALAKSGCSGRIVDRCSSRGRIIWAVLGLFAADAAC